MNAYSGQERRRHRLYVTRNTEYHLRDQRCVAVRDIWSGDWRPEHPAVGKTLFGAVRHGAGGLEPMLVPVVDSLLWFENGSDDILTSRLTAIARPPRDIVAAYPH
ncbi:MAG: hypothetical protein KC620_11945 [Myxococcales bacterium]|nr:hypothetical protein [Myxococcales bacterium]